MKKEKILREKGNGKPVDRTYLETGLPGSLQKAIRERSSHRSYRRLKNRRCCRRTSFVIFFGICLSRMHCSETLTGTTATGESLWTSISRQPKSPLYMTAAPACTPQLATEDMQDVLESGDEINKRVFVFPASSIEENGK